MTQIDTEAAAFMLGMTPNNFRVYVHRHPGEIRRVGTDRKGRALYNLDDVERLPKHGYRTQRDRKDYDLSGRVAV